MKVLEPSAVVGASWPLTLASSAATLEELPPGADARGVLAEAGHGEAEIDSLIGGTAVPSPA